MKIFPFAIFFNKELKYSWFHENYLSTPAHGTQVAEGTVFRKHTVCNTNNLLMEAFLSCFQESMNFGSMRSSSLIPYTFAVVSTESGAWVLEARKNIILLENMFPKIC